MNTKPPPSPCTFTAQDIGRSVQCIMDGVLYSSFQLDVSQADGYYLIYIRTGRGSLHRQNASLALFPGTIVFMDRKMVSTLEIIQPPFTASCFLLISAEADNAYMAYSSDGNPVFEINGFPEIPELVSRLLKLYPATSDVGRALYTEVTNDLFSYLAHCKSVEYENRTLPPFYILSMKQLLDTRYAESITLDTISSDLHINKYKLAKEFKTYYCISPIEYLIRRRIEAACGLLLDTEKTITEIGSDVAMENTPYFVRLFKQRKGISPLKYRTRNQPVLSEI